MKENVRNWREKRGWRLLAMGVPVLVMSSFLAVAAQEKNVPVQADSAAQKEHHSGERSEQTVLRVLPASPNLQEDSGPAQVAFDICTESHSWVRPAESEQQQQLQALPQYGAGFNPSASQIAQNFWTHDLFAFTDYGLSARVEPLYLTGLWSTIDTVWSCYDESRVSQINAGKMAEVWVLSHRVKAIQWQGDRYVMAVEPARGFQFIQFPRWEQQTTLPLEVVTIDGSALKVIATSLQ